MIIQSSNVGHHHALKQRSALSITFVIQLLTLSNLTGVCS